MKESKEIDYNSKILNFLEMTETGDPDIATQYLESSNWDEAIAVNKFYNKIKVNPSSTTNKNNNISNNIINNEEIIINDSNDNKIINDEINMNFSNNISENLIDKNIENVQNNNNENSQNGNCFNKYILMPILSLFNCCCYKKTEENNEELNDFFSLLPNINKDFIHFNEIIKTKIGIIILYLEANIPFLNKFINDITKNTLCMDLLKHNCAIFPILAKSDLGIKIKNIISDTILISPVFVFCYNPSRKNAILERKNVICKLEGETITLNSFQSILLDSYEKKNKNKNNLENNINNLTDGELLEKQKHDMEALEEEVFKKEEELKNQKLLENQKKIEEELEKEKVEKKLEELKKKVVDEPSEDNPNATTISFRYPDGEKRKDRRFLKTHTIQNLYDYITSLGNEIYTEEENNGFSLYQPFPPKKYDEMNNTLEKEGLFPNAIIQIREE